MDLANNFSHVNSFHLADHRPQRSFDSAVALKAIKCVLAIPTSKIARIGVCVSVYIVETTAAVRSQDPSILKSPLAIFSLSCKVCKQCICLSHCTLAVGWIPQQSCPPLRHRVLTEAPPPSAVSRPRVLSMSACCQAQHLLRGTYQIRLRYPSETCPAGPI